MHVWVEPDFDGTWFIACEPVFAGDLTTWRFGCVVPVPIEDGLEMLPMEVEALFPVFTSYQVACDTLREWAAGWDA